VTKYAAKHNMSEVHKHENIHMISVHVCYSVCVSSIRV